MNEVIANTTSSGPARCWLQARTISPVRPACRVNTNRFWPMPTRLKRSQVLFTALRQACTVMSKRASSRASAPKLLTTGLPPMASASAPPMRESSALEARLAGRMYLIASVTL